MTTNTAPTALAAAPSWVRRGTAAQTPNATPATTASTDGVAFDRAMRSNASDEGEQGDRARGEHDQREPEGGAGLGRGGDGQQHEAGDHQ